MMNFQAKYNLKFTHITPGKPQTYGKVEQAKNILKGILARKILENQNRSLENLLVHVVKIHNQHLSPSGYSPSFLIFETKPQKEELKYPTQVRKATHKVKNRP